MIDSKMVRIRRLFTAILAVTAWGFILQFNSTALAHWGPVITYQKHFEITENYSLYVEEYSPGTTIMYKGKFHVTEFNIFKKQHSTKIIFTFRLPLPWQWAYFVCCIVMLVVPVSVVTLFGLWMGKRIKAKRLSAQ